MHRFIGTLARGLAFAVLLGGISGAALAETVFNKGNGADPTTFDPQQMAVVAEAVIAVDLFEGLMTYGADGNAVPGAAESWAVSDDGLTYSFRLRADGKWSDGTPVTAADFVFGWQRLVDPETGSPYAANLDAVMNARDIRTGARRPADLGVRAIDTRTLEVTLAAPTPYFRRIPCAPRHRGGQPCQCRQVRGRRLQARQHRLERRLQPRRGGAAGSRQADPEPAFPRRRVDPDRHGDAHSDG
jgi:oligopeptide transport system substrate-binding protein